MPDAVLAVATLVLLIFLKLPRGFREVAREIIRDAQPPVRRVLRGIERDHLLVIRDRIRKPREEQPRIATPRVERHGRRRFLDLRAERPLVGGKPREHFVARLFIKRRIHCLA